MRKFELLVGVMAVVALVLAIIAFPPLVASEQNIGFDPGKLVRPSAVSAAQADITIPGNITASAPGYTLSVGWDMTADVYAGYGGALDLRVTNTNPTGSLFVYGMGLQWSSGETFTRNSSVIVPAGQQVDVGLLLFGAPAQEGSAYYKIVLKIAASNENGTEWYDYGTIYRDAIDPLAVKPLGTAGGYAVYSNPSNYYGKVNDRIGLDAVAPIVSEIKTERPGGYSVLQIAQAYQWVRDNIAYKDDGAQDYWQTTAETIGLRTGDCEDQSFLLAGIITGLGGNARVNIINYHAFPTVFVGTTPEDLAEVKGAMASFYGMDPSEYRMAYLQDDLGYWLVIDTTGFQYAGGIPAISAPTTASGEWSVKSPYLCPVDAVAPSDEGGGLWPF